VCNAGGAEAPRCKAAGRSRTGTILFYIIYLWRGPLNLAIEKTLKTAANRLSLEPEKGYFVYIISFYRTPGNQTCYEFSSFLKQSLNTILKKTLHSPVL
jgi:hypothetical protein